MKQTMMKSLVSLLLVAVLCIGGILPVFAAEGTCPEVHNTDNCTYEKTGEVKAECGKQGYTLYKCVACGAPFSGDFVSSDHEGYKVVDVKSVAATCTTPGKTEGWHCEFPGCGKVVESEATELAAHTWGSWAPVAGADCSTATKYERKCSVCETVETRDRDEETDGPLGSHSWKLVADKFVAPTCKTEGTATYECDKCHLTKTGKVSPVGTTDAHTFGAVTVVTAPTCAAKGSGTKTCSACGYVETVEIEKLTTHDVKVEDLIDVGATVPTCTTPGNQVAKKCPTCNEYVKVVVSGTTTTIETATDVVIAPLGHQMGSDATISGEITCTTAATAVYTCTRCDATVTQILGPNGHDYVETDVVEASCTSWGFKVELCTVCGHSEIIKTEPKNHGAKVKFDPDDYTGLKVVIGEEEYDVDDFAPLADSTCGSYKYHYEYCPDCAEVKTGSTVTGLKGDTFVKVEDKTVALKDHAWSDADNDNTNDKKVIQASDCVTKGWKAAYCKNCDAEKAGTREELPLVDHAKEDVPYSSCTTYTLISAADCANEKGAVVYVKCDKCGIAGDDGNPVQLILPVVHDMKEVKPSATLTITDIKDLYGVDYDDYTCADTTNTVGGTKLVACQNTGCTKHTVEEIKETVHAWAEDIDAATEGKQMKIKVNATCLAATHDLYYCTNASCDYSQAKGGFKDFEPYKNETVAIDPLKYHAHHTEYTGTTLNGSDLPAAGFLQLCTKDGAKALKIYSCSDCNTEFTVAQDHEWDETNYVDGHPIDYVAATCQSAGVTGTMTCKFCKTTKASTVIPKEDHHLVKGAKKDFVDCATTYWAEYKYCDNTVNGEPCDYTTKVEIKPHTDKLTLVAEYKAPTCQATGIKKLTVGSVTYEQYFSCSVCNKKLAAVRTEKTAEDGSKYFEYASLYYFDVTGHEKFADLTTKKVAHSGVKFMDVEATCTTFGYEATDCQWCNYVITENYVPATGHTWGTTPIVGGVQEQTCEKDASKTYKCTVPGCNALNTVVDQDKLATGHITADPDGSGPLKGTEIFHSCLDTHKDRKCVNTNCDFAHTDPAKDHIVPAEHVYDTYNFAATCYEYAYVMTICKFCNETKVEFDESAGKPAHTLTAWQTVAGDPTKEYRECTATGCDFEETRPTQTLHMNWEVVNGVKKGAAFVNTGIVELKISTSATKLDIYGIGLVIKYNNSVLSYLDYTVNSESFLEVHVGGKDGDAVGTEGQPGYVAKLANGELRVNAYASVPGADMTNITLDGDEVLVTVRFRVNADAPKDSVANFDIDLTNSKATNKVNESLKTDWNVISDNDPATVDTKIATLTTSLLGDVVTLDSGAAITMMDVTEMLRMITGEVETEYSAEADIDKDGEVTVADFVALQKYLVSGDYEELVANGVEEN